MRGFWIWEILDMEIFGYGGKTLPNRRNSAIGIAFGWRGLGAQSLIRIVGGMCAARTRLVHRAQTPIHGSDHVDQLQLGPIGHWSQREPLDRTATLGTLQVDTATRQEVHNLLHSIGGTWLREETGEKTVLEG